MYILLVGLNHKSAPLEVRERVSFSGGQRDDALPKFKDHVGECVIVSTCNRTEIYSVSNSPAETAEEIRCLLAGYHGLTPEAISPYLYEHTGADAVRHLFGVTSGLDSMIWGSPRSLVRCVMPSQRPVTRNRFMGPWSRFSTPRSE